MRLAGGGQVNQASDTKKVRSPDPVRIVRSVDGIRLHP